jgi:molybdate transport system substrate-binding protein
VSAGKAELILTLMSEIVPAKGIQYVGPLPAKFQQYVSFSAGIHPNSPAGAPATALIRALSEPGLAQTYERNGMELPIQTDIRRIPAPR